MGHGKGTGGDQSNIVAGSCCAICCGVCFLVIGLPMLIAGIVLVQMRQGEYDDTLPVNEIDLPEHNEDEVKEILYQVGIGMIVVSVAFVVIGILFVVLLCTGCCKQNRMTSNQGAVINVHQQTTYPVQPNTYTVNQGYYPNQPVVYIDSPQQQYIAVPPEHSYMTQLQGPQKA